MRENKANQRENDAFVHENPQKNCKFVTTTNILATF